MLNDDYTNLKALIEGSQSAFARLYNQYSGKLHHFISRISNGDTWLTEELVQRTFIKVWENREQINPNKSFLAYMCTIAKNMLLNELEHRMIEFVYQEYLKQKEYGVEYSADKDTELKILEEIINDLTNQLPPARKQIFILSVRMEYSIKEIAEKLNLAETTVQTQRSKALSFMQKQLAKHYQQRVGRAKEPSKSSKEESSKKDV